MLDMTQRKMDASQARKRTRIICPVSRRIQKQSVTEVSVDGYIVLVKITFIFSQVHLTLGKQITRSETTNKEDFVIHSEFL